MRDAVDASAKKQVAHSRIERARRKADAEDRQRPHRIASSGHGKKPTPKIEAEAAQKCSPATRDAVDASIEASGTQSHRAGTAKSRRRR
eukprot:scaffold141043_cov151-Phaeocystis_antarctica.AAC.1